MIVFAMNVQERLAELVSFDTQNPMGRERPLCDKLAADLRALGAASVEVAEVATGLGAHAYVYACFGAAPPRLLLNAHVDTVPANSGYTSAPHTLTARDGRLVGLGSADTKGAIAAIPLETGEGQDVGPTGHGAGVVAAAFGLIEGVALEAVVAIAEEVVRSAEDELRVVEEIHHDRHRRDREEARGERA